MSTALPQLSSASIRSTRPLVLLLPVCIATVSACANHGGIVRERAPHDLKCPKDQIEIAERGGMSFSATGCGRTVTYTCEGGMENDSWQTAACRKE